MFGLELLSTGALGVAAACVAGVLTLIPALAATDSRRAGVAVGVLVLFVLSQSGFVFTTLQEFATTFFQAAVYAVVTYKLLLQSLVLPVIDAGLIKAGLKSDYTG